ncbi:tyrosine-protein kinase Lyn-like isoform X2 [Littorina saxatilis]|uniref:Tyrosine-protein kinase n=1 Tax=Littorina saxatilis TaxID=31220 RepID=A0AAN9B5G2_9CAEN
MGKRMSRVMRRPQESAGHLPTVSEVDGRNSVDFNPNPKAGRKKSNLSESSSISTNNIPVSINGKKKPLPAVPPKPKPKPKTLPVPRDGLIVRALYDFPAVNADDLPFKKGDRLKVDESTKDLDWWMATHLTTLQKGYVPHNYVCTDDNSPQTQEWWFEDDRKEADLMLLLPGNMNGTFLVRGAHDKKSHVLSVRHEDPQTGDPLVKHYRIRQLDNGGYYISAKKQFEDLFQLIEYYSSDVSNSLCARLSKPCPRLKPFQMRFDDLEMDRSGIELQVRLGQGHFGEVWKGKLKHAAEVAVKTLKTGTMTPALFLEEAKIMHTLRHKKLVNLLAVCSTQEPIWIVTELMTNGALLDYLRKDKTPDIVKFPMLVKMAAQIADGMAYLERANYVHRDLRAANILVGEHHDVKVADFGLARILDKDDVYDASDNAKFPIKWTAPEAGLSRRFSVKSDVWSFGILLYEIFTYGRVPYPGVYGDILLKVEGGYRMPNPDGSGKCVCPPPVYDTMQKCWQYEPADRPTFEFLKTFFEDYEVSTEEHYQTQ